MSTFNLKYMFVLSHLTKINIPNSNYIPNTNNLLIVFQAFHMVPYIFS